MGTAKQAEMTKPYLFTADRRYQLVASEPAGGDEIADPLLQFFHTPKQLHMRNWKEVAERYRDLAEQYHRKNNRHIDELKQQADHFRVQRVEQLEASCKEYERLKEAIKFRDGMIDQLKATIHLLTKGER